MQKWLPLQSMPPLPRGDRFGDGEVVVSGERIRRREAADLNKYIISLSVIGFKDPDQNEKSCVKFETIFIDRLTLNCEGFEIV